MKHHDIFGDAKSWVDSYHSASYYTDDYGYFETVAFWFLAIWYMTLQGIVAILMFITAFIWIVPYMMYKRHKRRKQK